ncbi:hypothetical protein TNCV_1481391 [Trichonephila clavipes]|nr:hypothetical protein TNCV_1481391 [Trichonephila clavipes]
MPENDEDVDVEGTIQTSKISHTGGLKAVEASLQYFEQGASAVTPNNLDDPLVDRDRLNARPGSMPS